MSWILEHASVVRAGAFFAPLVGLSLVEAARPRRAATPKRGARWPLNLALAVLGAVAARLVVPAGVIGAALWAEGEGVGALRVLGAPPWLAFAMALAVLDLAIYAQHVALHRSSLLWRLHRIHHTDRDLDATSAGRFHPLEIVGSLAWKAGVAVAIGAPAEAVAVYEALFALFAVVTHANIDVAVHAQRRLASALVTPDLHRIHHSVRPDESLSNFGTVTTLWDRLFGTLRREAAEDQRVMALGVTRDTPSPRRSDESTCGVESRFEQ